MEKGIFTTIFRIFINRYSVVGNIKGQLYAKFESDPANTNRIFYKNVKLHAKNL